LWLIYLMLVLDDEQLHLKLFNPILLFKDVVLKLLLLLNPKDKLLELPTGSVLLIKLPILTIDNGPDPVVLVRDCSRTLLELPLLAP